MLLAPVCWQQPGIAAAVHLQISVKTRSATVPMGGCVHLRIRAREPDGSAAAGATVFPYVNGRQWGASGVTDAGGRAQITLPLPMTGTDRIQVATAPASSPFLVGTPLSTNQAASRPVTVRVLRRRIAPPRVDPQHRIGVEWEPWFTPLNAHWDTAEAVPMVGLYSSFNTDVIRQHAIWLDEAGADFLLVDWSNNLWGKQHWADRAPGVDELITAFDTLLDEYVRLRAEGVPTPQVTLLLGLDNGPQTTTAALHEEMDWVYQRYLENAKYSQLWVQYLGRPLIVLFNGGGPGFLKSQPPLSDQRFTIRWMGSQLQANHLDRAGYWSWMDGSIEPVVTRYKGQAEALTITPAFFGDGGWTYPQAHGREGGATYKAEWKRALRARPAFLLINQWNEFAGQPNGAGYGPEHDQYVDCYSPERSNDIEPTSIQDAAYRGSGGWGFLYLDLTRRWISRYRTELRRLPRAQRQQAGLQSPAARGAVSPGPRAP